MGDDVPQWAGSLNAASASSLEAMPWHMSQCSKASFIDDSTSSLEIQHGTQAFDASRPEHSKRPPELTGMHTITLRILGQGVEWLLSCTTSDLHKVQGRYAIFLFHGMQEE